jgi:hypothetical protein
MTATDGPGKGGWSRKADRERAEARPKALSPRPEAIPAGLRDRKQWVCWRYERRDGKWTKVPINAVTGRNASATDSATWSAFASCLAYYHAHRATLDGIGYVLSSADPFTGIDLDDARDGATVKLLPWAAEIVATLDTYAEVSPSGTGVKLFVEAQKPGKGCKARYASGEVEIYSQARFFVVTGHALPASPATINPRQEQLTALYHHVFDQGTEKSLPNPSGKGHLDDGVLLKIALGERSGKFARLWHGDTSEYGGDDSRADAALTAKLAFYLNGNARRMDQWFRQSGLMRAKWDEPRGEQTYGQRTIAYALDHWAGEHYEPLSPSQPVVAASAPAGTAHDAPTTGQAITLRYFRDKYRPLFRHGTALYSEALAREVKPSEACFAASSQLIELLAQATDAPRNPDGSLKRSGLPHFFRNWAPVAWQDLMDLLPEEEGTEEISPSAEEQFRNKIRAVLLHLEALKYGHRDGPAGELDVQRRSLIDWCNQFAKPGNWQNIRSFQLWTRRTEDGRLQVALRKDLFSQVAGCAELGRLSQNRFARLCERYRVGDSIRAGGDRAVALTPEFIAGLLAQPDSIVDDSAPPHAHARTREH